MGRELTEEVFHEILGVICKGSEDKAMYIRIMADVFPTLPDEQRDFYWDSFERITGIGSLLHTIGLSGEPFTEMLEEITSKLYPDHHENSDRDIPDNVTSLSSKKK